MFKSFKYSLEFWYSDLIHFHLIFVYMEFMSCIVKITMFAAFSVYVDLYYDFLQASIMI